MKANTSFGISVCLQHLRSRLQNQPFPPNLDVRHNLPAYFQPKLLSDLMFKDWLHRGAQHLHTAVCVMLIDDVSTVGHAAVTSHGKGTKHKDCIAYNNLYHVSCNLPILMSHYSQASARLYIEALWGLCGPEHVNLLKYWCWICFLETCPRTQIL